MVIKTFNQLLCHLKFKLHLFINNIKSNISIVEVIRYIHMHKRICYFILILVYAFFLLEPIL